MMASLSAEVAELALRENEKARWLFSFTDALYRAASAEAAYNSAIETIVGALGCERASILLFEGDDDRARFVAWRGLSDAYRAATDGHSPWGRGELSPSPIYIEDLREWRGGEDLRRVVEQEGIAALAFIPLTVKDQTVGKFMAYFDRPRRFSSDDKFLALMIARQLGFWIERNRAEERLWYMAAVVDSSDDAIVTKDLDGRITSWNRGAERLFGYRPEEALGRNITLIVPPERLGEEQEILRKIRKGDPIRHFETVRRRRDGTLVDISLTVSPVKDLSGAAVGASKIARDVSERRRASEQRELLLREMQHRIRNLFTLAVTIVQMSARSAQSAPELAETVASRLTALATAQSLTFTGMSTERRSPRIAKLIESLTRPFQGFEELGDPLIRISGDDREISEKAATSLALVIHELATNAMKYGGLSQRGRGVFIECRQDAEGFRVSWREPGVETIEGKGEGFGSRLLEATVRGQLGGSVSRSIGPTGYEVTLLLPDGNLDA